MGNENNSAVTSSVNERMQQAIRYDRTGRSREAARIYQEILEQVPGHPYALYFLGINALKGGHTGEAVQLIRSAVEGKQDEPVFYEYLGQALQAEGDYSEALAAYDRLLALSPEHPAASFRRGTVLREMDNREAAVPAFQAAIQRDPSRVAAHLQLGQVLLDLRRLDEAIEGLQLFREDRPDIPEVYIKLGLAFKFKGDYESALTFYEHARKLNPQIERAYIHLGDLYLAWNKYRLAQKIYHEFYEMKRGSDRGRAVFSLPAQDSYPPDLPPVQTSKFYLQNLAEHIEYLVEHDRVDSSCIQMADACHSVLDEIASHDDSDGFVILDESQSNSVRSFYNRVIHYADTPEPASTVLGNKTDFSQIETDFINAELPMVVFDDYLSPEALEALRNFCLESTIFFLPSRNIYLTSQIYDGFNCSLLYDIASELQTRLPRILGGKELTNMWVYRHPPQGSGVRAHSDNAAVTVNFWLTPDNANLDQEHGGLVVYDRMQPMEWDWYETNALKDTPRVLEKIMKYLDSANTVTVPYRENRALIFNSSLFHASDSFQFADGYTNRRMNVTMLFGERT